jgi:hypothetical protein
MKFALLLACCFATSLAALAGCDDEDNPVLQACERLDECNALNAGVSVEECVEMVDRNLDQYTSSQRSDWEGLMRSCLDFDSCQLYIDCVERSDL